MLKVMYSDLKDHSEYTTFKFVLMSFLDINMNWSEMKKFALFYNFISSPVTATFWFRVVNLELLLEKRDMRQKYADRTPVNHMAPCIYMNTRIPTRGQSPTAMFWKSDIRHEENMTYTDSILSSG